MSDPTSEHSEEEKNITYEDFEIFMEDNPVVDNSDIYDAFPSKPEGTLRRWKKNYLDAQLEREQSEPNPEQIAKEETIKTIERNNKALMRSTNLSEKQFEGMDPQSVNKFLINHINAQKRRGTPNTPIMGTPIGSGIKTYGIDEYLTIDPKAQRIEFEAPASKVLAKANNKKEAEQLWLEQR